MRSFLVYAYNEDMHTIELSKEVKIGEPLVMTIPVEELTEHVGTQAKIIVLFEPHTQPPRMEDDTAWDEIVRRIQSEPIPSEYIIPATEVFTEAMVDELLAGEDQVEFDAAAWDMQWDAYEVEMKQLAREKEQAFLEDTAKLLK